MFYYSWRTLSQRTKKPHYSTSWCKYVRRNIQMWSSLLKTWSMWTDLAEVIYIITNTHKPTCCINLFAAILVSCRCQLKFFSSLSAHREFWPLPVKSTSLAMFTSRTLPTGLWASKRHTNETLSHESVWNSQKLPSLALGYMRKNVCYPLFNLLFRQLKACY